MNYRIEKDGLAVCIDDAGAQLTSVCWQDREYLWQGDPAYWSDQSLLLFPYVGRFTEGKYTLDQKEYPMDIHGFAKDSAFSVCASEEGRIVFGLRDNEETLSVYPFHFDLSVTYEINGNTLHVSYDVQNRSEGTMYFGIGGHPGFKVPLEEDLSFEDHYLEFSHPHLPSRVGHTPACFLSGIDTDFPLEHGTVLPLHHEMFDDDAIVLKNVADTVTLKADGSTHSVTMHYPGLPYLGLWHAPRTDAPYICIEPWSSLPSRQDVIEDLACKSDLIRLAADSTYHTGWSMTLR